MNLLVFSSSYCGWYIFGDCKIIKSLGTFSNFLWFIIADLRKERIKCSTSSHLIPTLFIPTILIEYFKRDTFALMRRQVLGVRSQTCIILADLVQVKHADP